MTLLAPAMPPPVPSDFTSVLEVREVDPRQEAVWDDWVAMHPEAGPFHSSAWARVLHRTYGHRPCYLSLHRGGRPVALLPLMEVDSPLTGRRGVCLPFADECGLLLFEKVNPRLLLDVLSRVGREHSWRHVEVRGAAGLPVGALPSVEFYAHHLDLRPGLEAVHRGFHPSVGRALRKAAQEGLTVEVRTDQEAMRAFCGLHARNRRRHGLPPQPDRFFEVIRQEFLEPGSGAVVLASRGPTPVAAAVFFQTGTRALYKFGASDERAQATRANNLVMWHGIQWLAGRGAASLHFGRTSCFQEGLRRYKRGWGASESVIPYYKLALPAATWVRERDRAAGFHTSLFANLPLTFNRLLGAVLYPHLD
jgi:lipid II:glycine glycyltransferase (peptidoglycan interpeptide bridge formation enzyme)